jgi:hypothetical protein
VTGDDKGSAFAGLAQRGLVGKLHARLDELLEARDQMERLLRMIVEIGAGLDRDATLHRIITAARELTSAPYGALAIRDRDGNLVSFVHEGMDDETVRLIGHLPVGRGLLSLSLLDTPALRMDNLSTHRAAVGFPEHHPPMRAFLAVPITIRGTVFGNLYLTHIDPTRVFSDPTRSPRARWRSRPPSPSIMRKSSNANGHRRSGRKPAARSPPRCCRGPNRTGVPCN